MQNAIFNSANSSSIATDEKGVIQIFNVGAERRGIKVLPYSECGVDAVYRLTHTGAGLLILLGSPRTQAPRRIGHSLAKL